MESLVHVFVALFGLYFLLGILFSLAFLWKGIDKVDEGAVGTSRWFKFIIWPGIVAFWPALLSKWIKS